MCILHWLGKSSEEVKLFIDDIWAQMVSCQEQSQVVCTVNFLRHKSSENDSITEKFGGCEVISVVT